MVPKSNVSFEAIKNNKTLFDCVGKECFDKELFEKENEEKEKSL